MNPRDYRDISVFGDFVDGNSARLHRVQVTVVEIQGKAVVRIALPDGENEFLWLLSSLRAIPDQAERGEIVLGQAGDADTARLIIRDRSVAKQFQAVCPDLNRVNKTPNLWRRLTLLTSGAVASVALIVFVLVPVMADQLAPLLPPKGEEALGNTTFEQIRKIMNEDSDEPVRICDRSNGLDALDTMISRLNNNDDVPYELKVHVLDHDLVNAFALPGGMVVLFRGLLEYVDSPEELAGIVGHELGHLAHRDYTRLALRSAGSLGVLGLLLGDFAGGTLVLFLSESLTRASFSRGAESLADTYAHARLAQAGLPSSRMGDFFLRNLGEEEAGSTLATHLGTHPDPQGRVDAAVKADTIGGSDFYPVLSHGEWRALKNICKER